MKIFILLLISGLFCFSTDAQIVNIPDANFKSALLNHSPVINTNGDAEIQVSEALAFTGTMNVSNKNIVDMTGVEAFTKMTILNCQRNKITALSTTGLNGLQLLWCSFNQLTSLTVTNLPALRQLYCQQNLLTSITTTNLPILTELRVSDNKLTTLSVSNFPLLAILDCYNNSLTSLSLTNVNALYSLSCSNNHLSALPLNNTPNLQVLDCSSNQFTQLPLSGVSSLNNLDCTNNQISSITVNNPSNLAQLKCSNNQLTTLQPGMTALQFLFCANNHISSVDVSNATYLTALDFSGNMCTSFSLSSKNFLQNLSCRTNQLTSLTLSNLPALKYLDCDSNKLPALSLSNFPALYSLACDNNLLTSLTVSNMPSLFELSCTVNKLQTLSITNFPLLDRLYCDNNQLTSLTVSNLPKLQLLYCSYNQFTSLPLSNLPLLDQLQCTYTNLTTLSLSNFPSMRYLICSNNKIKSINLSNLPKLGNLQIEHNLFDTLQLSGLPLIDGLICGRNNLLTYVSLNLPSLRIFLCDSTRLTKIDLSQTGVTSLRISNNPLLQYLNIHNAAITATGSYQEMQFLPALQFICVDYNELGWFINVTNTQLPGQSINLSTFCTNPTNSYNTIKGTVRFDVNGNGCNNQDSAMNNVKIKIIEGADTWYTFTDTAGNYTAYATQSNNDTIAPVFENPYFITTPASYAVNFSGYGNTQVADFCITPNGIRRDLEISMVPVGGVRPGFDATYKIVYRNKGNQVQSGTIDLNFNNTKLSFVSATPNIVSQTPGNLSWSFAGLSPYQTKTILLKLHVSAPPTTNLGDTLIFKAVINPIPGDEIIPDNTFNYKQRVTASVDPNDKEVAEGAAINISQAGDYLHYTIRFQNTGNAPAVNVVIKDSLSDNLDWNSMTPITASHPYRTVVNKGNKAEFIFDNINLPDKISDEPASHGFIAFKIRPKASIAVGETILNNVGIYFDFNPPVITNTVSTTVINPRYNSDPAGLSISPNPAKDWLSISVNAGRNIQGINLFNSVGEKVYSESFQNGGTNQSINIANLNAGIYILVVHTVQWRSVQKVIIVK